LAFGLKLPSQDEQRLTVASHFHRLKTISEPSQLLTPGADPLITTE